MFTGLIEEKGILQGLHLAGTSGTITIGCRKVLAGTRMGDSIAVNGICLTVTDLGASYFAADVTAETVRRTDLRDMSPGDPVNLERAMPADGRFGGHIVTGHIDGTGTIREMRREGNGIFVTIGAGPDIMRLVCEKGSVAVDGISLTVASLSDSDFTVCIIPHTGEETTLTGKKTGDPVNLENDIIGKYLDRLIQRPKKRKESSLSISYLEEIGF